MAQTIIVDITPGYRMPTIYYSQNDVGTQFAIDLRSRFGDSLPASPTVTIQATKPSGFGFSVVADSITNGVATFTTTDEMTDESGRFPAELKVEASGVTLFTANFYMEGEANTHPEGTIDGQQETVIPELTQLVERVETAASSVLDMTVEAETLAAGSQATYSYDEDTNTATFGIPQGEAGAGAAGVTASAYSSSKTYAVGDYVIHNSNLYRCTTAITTAEAFTAAHWTQVVLADDVADVKSAFGEITDHTKNIFEGEFVQGNINVTTGADTDNLEDYFIKTGYIPVLGSTYYTFSSITPTNQVTFLEYASDKSFIKYTRNGTGTEGSNVRKSTLIQTASNTRFLRLRLGGSSGSNTYTPSDVTQPQLEKGAEATAYEYPYTAYDKIARNGIDVLNAKPDVYAKTRNILNVTFENGNINGTTGEPSTSAVDYFVRFANFQKVSGLTYYSFSCTTKMNKCKFMYYDESYGYLSKSNDMTNGTSEGQLVRRHYTVNMPVNTSFVKIVLFGGEGTNTYTPADVIDPQLEVSRVSTEYINQYSAVDSVVRQQTQWAYSLDNIICIGDSLTHGLYADISLGSLVENYPHYLGRMLNTNVATMDLNGGAPSTIYAGLSEYDFADYDAVLIWLGTNGGLANPNITGTEANYYTKIIDKIKSDNADCLIVLANVFVTGVLHDGVTPETVATTNATINSIATTYGLHVVDMSDLGNNARQDLRNNISNNHFGKAGNIYIAQRWIKDINGWMELNPTRAEFGYHWQ